MLGLAVAAWLAAAPTADRFLLEGTRVADKVALRRLFDDSEFVALTAALEGLQSLADASCDDEDIGIDAFEAFFTSAASEPALFDRWVKASPQSYAPLLARAMWRYALAEERRGGAYASKTTDQQWRGMEALIPLVRNDIDASIAIHPTTAARRLLMLTNLLTSTPEPKGPTQLALILKQCPGSLVGHMTAMRALLPRWGGSYPMMVAFAARAPTGRYPRLKALLGAVEQDKGLLEKDDEKALAHFDKAIAAGRYYQYWSDKGRALSRLHRYQEALAAFDQSLADRPQRAQILLWRANALFHLGRDQESERAARLARAIDPAETQDHRGY